MKKIVTTLAIIAATIYAIQAQKHDNVWVLGSKANSTGTMGGLNLYFSTSPPTSVYINRNIRLYSSSSSIADSSGQLAFYTNGCDIFSAGDTVMANGKTINPGEVHELQCDQDLQAYTAGAQSTLPLPVPETPGLYYLFHKRIIYIYTPTFDVLTNTLFYSVIDMNQNGGQGTVTAKNVPLIQDSLAFGEMTAVKHADGINWWLITPRNNSNQFYVLLLTKDGIVDTLLQTIGALPTAAGVGGGQLTFNSQGDLLARYNPKDPLKLYDFDRATGTFTGYQEIPIMVWNYPVVAVWRFLPTADTCMYQPTTIFSNSIWKAPMSLVLRPW